MQRSNNRRKAYLRRRRQRRNRMILIAVLLIAVVVIVIACTRRTDKPAAVPAVTATEMPVATEAPTPEPTLVPTPTPEPVATASPEFAGNAIYRPKAKEGCLPVFRKAETEEKIIAITVDDCFQAENLRTIVRTAAECGGRLTIFPIGDEAAKPAQTEILRWAWENGFELENHTYTHSALYDVTDEKLAYEIYQQNKVLSGIVGQEYQAHFIRPRGGDARDDQRIHAYAKQIGYYGVAHWSISGSGSDIDKLRSTLTPGAIYLFHTTDKDMAKLVEFIPYAVGQGYRLVTLNELFGYPANEVKPLEKPIEQYEVPALEPYDVVPVTYKQTSYAYGVVVIQQKLIAMGYLEGAADGIYGPGCAAAVEAFQRERGIEPTGIADPATQDAISAAYAAAGSPELPPVGKAT